MLTPPAQDDARLASASLTIWIVSEGSPGHVSQSKGLAEAIASLTPTRTFQVEVRQKGRGWRRGLFRFLFNLAPRLRPFWVKHCSRWEELPTDVPDLLIASGGKSIFLARSLADQVKIPLVFCGSPEPYPTCWFDCVLSTELPCGDLENWIHTDVLLNPVTPEIVKTAADGETSVSWSEKMSSGSKVGVVLVGGRSRSQRFVETDWLALAGQMNLLAERDNWRWLIATSRRTGEAVEALLESALAANYVLDAVWWSRKPRKVVRTFLGHADLVLVGRDSMTMISEAVCSGRPVVVFGPEESTPSKVNDGFVENLVQKRIILKQSCSELSFEHDLSKSLNPLAASPVQSYARKVLDQLDLVKSI